MHHPFRHVDPRVLICHRAPSGSHGTPGPYHTGGLAANANHSEAVLQEMGYTAFVRRVASFSELERCVEDLGPTHVIIEAVWVTIPELERLTQKFKHTEFVVRAHSKIGFLQVEPEAVLLMKRIIDLSNRQRNVKFATNNLDFYYSLVAVYGPALYLPNLYDLKGAPPRRPKRRLDGRETLKMASFGASRLLKLHPDAALAAMRTARVLDRDLEFYVNTDRTPGGDSVRKTIRNMFADHPRVSLVELPWQDPHTFRHTIRDMDLVYQLSATETFCLVAADAVAVGVPLVASPAISWLSRDHVNPDDTSSVTSESVKALTRPKAYSDRQYDDLTRWEADARLVWRDYLERGAPVADISR